MDNHFFKIYKKDPFDYFFKNYDRENTILVDIFNTLFLIYYKDTHDKRTDSGLKELSLEIQVYNVDKFNNLKKEIERLIKFMTQEKWNLTFINKNYSHVKQTKIKISTTPYEKIALLSGGLDSFTGTYFNKNLKTRYIGFRINDQETKSQKNIESFLKEIDTTGSQVKYHSLNRSDKKLTLTQRTRSLFFFGLGIVEVFNNNLNYLDIYENGIMSLNPAIDFTRRTTKTTHPKTLFMFNKILSDLNLDIILRNTCMNLTKGEMVEKLSERYKKIIQHTTTCGISRQNINFDNKNFSQCGACIPCILRKITMTSHDNEKFDNKYQIPYGYPINTNPENKNKKLLTEYKSAIIYFKDFRDKIKNGEIKGEIKVIPKYYPDNNMDELDQMLEEFTKEVDYFFDKYSDILK